MSDSTPGLPRKQTKIGPKHFEDEPPRVEFRGRDDGYRSRRRPEPKTEPFEPTKLTDAPKPGDPLYEPDLLHQFLYHAWDNPYYQPPGEMPPMTMEQQRIMDQVVWRLKNGD